jgi:DNA-binding Lrp family transcriptional regulator
VAITAIVLIEAEPDAIADLGPKLTEIDGVAEAHSVAGSDVDLVAIVKVADHEAIAHVVTEAIAKLAGIRTTNTLIAFRSYSAQTLNAAYEGFGD